MNEELFLKRTQLLQAWLELEKTLPNAKNSHEYQLVWGKAREEFYKEVGYIPCDIKEQNRLKGLKGKFTGERIFVMGNGPSLNKTPLELLENEFTFVTNRAYLLFDRINWRPSFYTALDWRVVPDIAHEINLLTGVVCFFEERFKGLLREDDDVFWYTHTPAFSSDERSFAYNIENGVRGAGSVIGTAIQIAFYLGFSEIYLIGCDLGYKVNKTVKQEGEDVFGTGTKLFLTSTEDDDPNHFDKRYFGKGKRWHDPNVPRMISGHEQCRTGVLAKGGKIYNATIGGELEVYERVDFLSLFDDKAKTNSVRQKIQGLISSVAEVLPYPHTQNILCGEFLRCEGKHLDETDIIFLLIGDNSGQMIDVGAHRGTSCQNFLISGWKVIAFEPDSTNRLALTKMIEKIGYSKNIRVEDAAVGESSVKDVKFFKSQQSSGISGLHSFHDTHYQAGTVDIVALSDYLSENPVTKVGFLKIDTEGHDLFVLKGFPWHNFKPAVIECEFEDSKTVPLGYTFHDLADYLVDKGYTVYVSEWHPIIRYGIRHNWRQFSRYPCKLADVKGWGNLIAFRDVIDENKLIKALHALLKDGKPQPSLPSQNTVPVPKTIDTLLQFPLEPTFKFFKMSASDNFVELSESIWRYKTIVSETQTFWAAIFDVQGKIQNIVLLASLILQTSNAVTLKVSLGRHGTETYEGNHQTISLSPNKPQRIQVDKSFSKDYLALKVQIEVLKIENNDTVDLKIDMINVDIFSIAKIRQRITNENLINLSTANNLLRVGDYAKALDIYILLYMKQPLRIYSDNALMCGRKLGLKSINTLNDLLQHI